MLPKPTLLELLKKQQARGRWGERPHSPLRRQVTGQAGVAEGPLPGPPFPPAPLPWAQGSWGQAVSHPRN